jgi:hypothetical protein
MVVFFVIREDNRYLAAKLLEKKVKILWES